MTGAGAAVVGKPATPALASTLRRTSSLVRLSTSLDGKAKVAIGNSPSPPKVRMPRPIGGLQRSQSAIQPGNKTTGEFNFPAVQPKKSSMPGRSRDARTWVFYCDSSARDALTEQAEREQSGSAVGAIGLIRSRSNKVLASNPNKRNARPENHDSIKRLKADDKEASKRKLSRSQSSVARLQTVGDVPRKQAAAKWRKTGKPRSELDIDYSGDSDKENWEPGTQSRTQHRRTAIDQAPSSRISRPVLTESLKVPSHSTSLDALMAQEKPGARGLPVPSTMLSGTRKHEDQHAAEATDGFADGAQMPREADELDCVQNLLSLSQGNWQ